ncbi:hypothetical protein KAX02_13690 [candidate division WOR-3 bacterium]|nr:hypothetical protein [candidate division WOR-3 bacterium]
MPSGRLAAVDIKAGANILIYQTPGGQAFNVTVRICNCNDTDIKIRLALTEGGLSTLSNDDYLEYDTIIRANGNLERSGISMAGNQSIVGYSDNSNVTFQVGGN